MDLAKCKKIVLFGGSFDPPHVAHVRLPDLVRRGVDADVTVYMPSGLHPIKHRDCTPARHRVAMLRLALERVDGACVRTDEIARAEAGEPTYTVDTLNALRAELGDAVELRLLIGGDNLRDLHNWKAPGEIVALAQPVVMVRPPDTREAILAALPAEYDRGQWSKRFVDVPRIDVSSTQVRRLIAEGQPIAGFVGPAVEAYIREHGLYRAGSP